MFWMYLLYHLSLWMFPPADLYAHGSHPNAFTAPGLPQAVGCEHQCLPHPAVCPGTAVGIAAGPLPPPVPACPDVVLYHNPMPAFGFCPAQMPGVYRIDVRFTDGPKEVPPIRTSLLVPETTPQTMGSIAWHHEGALKSCTLTASLVPAGHDCVDLSLRLTPGDTTEDRHLGLSPFGKCRFRARQTVHLDTVTSVVLRGRGSQSYTAEVTISRARTEPPAPVAYPGCPAYSPCPVPPVAMHMPPPVCCPVPTMPCYQQALDYSCGSHIHVGPPVPTMPCYQQAPVVYPLPDPIPLPPPCVPIPPPAVPVYTGPITPPVPPSPTRVVSQPRATPTQHISLVRHGEKSRLQMKGDDGCTTCVRMTREMAAVGKLTLAAGKKHIHVSGANWKALADEADLGPDGRIVLRGHVKLVSDKVGVCARVKADELCIQVRRGQLEKIIVTATSNQPRAGTSEQPPVATPQRVHGGTR